MLSIFLCLIPWKQHLTLNCSFGEETITPLSPNAISPSSWRQQRLGRFSWFFQRKALNHNATTHVSQCFFSRTRNLSLKTSNRISPRILHKDVCLSIVPVTQMSLALALFQVPTLYICFDAMCSLQPNSYSPKRLNKSSPGSKLFTPKEHVGRIEYMGGWSGQSWCQQCNSQKKVQQAPIA